MTSRLVSRPDGVRRDRAVLSADCAASAQRRSATSRAPGKQAVLDGALRADVDRIAALLFEIARAARNRWTVAELDDGDCGVHLGAAGLSHLRRAAHADRRRPIAPSSSRRRTMPPPRRPSAINAFIADALLRAPHVAASRPDTRFRAAIPAGQRAGDRERRRGHRALCLRAARVTQ